MNHSSFPKEDHLPNCARRDNKVTKGDRVGDTTSGVLQDTTSGVLQDSTIGVLQDTTSCVLQDTASGVLHAVVSCHILTSPSYKSV